MMAQQAESGNLFSWFTPIWRHRAVLALMFLGIFFTYQPATRHPPRQDQWSFLLDTVNEERFLPLLVHTYSYNRTRAVGWGDYPLFRPGLFAVLSLEKALFGQRHALAQVVGMGLHAAVVWVLVGLLLGLHRAYPTTDPFLGRLRVGLAYLLPIFFAVNPIGVEMVTWSHIHGYTLYILLILSGWLVLLPELTGDAPAGHRGRLAGAWLLTVAAAFTYETGAAYAVGLGAVLGLVYSRTGRRRTAVTAFGLFASILPLFVSVNWVDRLNNPNMRPDITEASVLDQAGHAPTVDHARRYLLFTLGMPWFPTCPPWRFNDRLDVPEPGTTPQAYWGADPWLIASYAVVVAAVGLAGIQALRLLARRSAWGRSLFLLLPVGLIFLHLGIIVLGRMNMRPGPTVLSRQSYYAYPVFLSFLTALYFLWVRWPGLPTRLTRPALLVVLLGVALLSAASAVKVHCMTVEMRTFYRPLQQEISRIQRAVDAHRHEPHFRLGFDPDLLYSLPQYHGLPELEILFGRYIDHERATYVVTRDEGVWRVLPAGEYERLHGGPRERGIATLVRPGELMVYRFRGRYYGLPWRQGRFQVERTDYAGLRQGDSPEACLAHAP